jgi:ribosomal protein S12 methylthiotransferase accessory factor YcaO
MEALQRLQREWPLRSGWTIPEQVCDTLDVGGLRIARVGLLGTRPGARRVTGSAADIGEDPTDRAFFELLERMGTVDALERAAPVPLIDATTGQVRGALEPDELFPKSLRPAEWVYSLSNGVAFHTDRPTACEHALWELVERDRILRAWHGQLRLERAELPPASPLHALSAEYDMRAFLVPDVDPSGFAAEVRVAVVLGFPKRPGIPLIHGFGARPRAAGALTAAGREALQRLAFVWDETIPPHPPEVRPTPETHLDWYLYPAHHHVLREWVEGHHTRYAADVSAPPLAGPPIYADMTPSWLRGRGWLIKAFVAHALPLTFGRGPGAPAGHLPEPMRVHPIA